MLKIVHWNIIFLDFTKFFDSSTESTSKAGASLPQPSSGLVFHIVTHLYKWKHNLSRGLNTIWLLLSTQLSWAFLCWWIYFYIILFLKGCVMKYFTNSLLMGLATPSVPSCMSPTFLCGPAKCHCQHLHFWIRSLVLELQNDILPLNAAENCGRINSCQE